MRIITLHRATLKELLATLLFSLIGFTFVFLFVVSFQYLRKGLPGEYLLAFLPHLVAPILVVTMAVGCLFATTLTYSRQASDQEIQAAQWSGVRLHTLAAPALLMGALGSLACVLLNDQVVPHSNARIRALKEKASRELPILLAALNEPVFATPTQKMYISGVNGNVFSGLVVMETTNSVTTRILNAREAHIRFDDKARKTVEFDLADGSLEIFDPGPPPRVTEQAVFERYPLRIQFDAQIEVWQDWEAATRREIQEALRRRLAGGGVGTGDASYQIGSRRLYLGGYRKNRVTDVILYETLEDGSHRAVRAPEGTLRIDLENRLLLLKLGPGRLQALSDMTESRQVLSETPFDAWETSLPLEAGRLGLPGDLTPSTAEVEKILKDRVLEAQQVWHEAKVELQERMSTAMAPLCFTAIGVPLGIWLRHGNRLVSFGASLLVVFCLYFPAFVAGKQLSLTERIPAAVGLWLPNVAMILAGLAFTTRVRR